MSIGTSQWDFEESRKTCRVAGNLELNYVTGLEEQIEFAGERLVCVCSSTAVC
jgi:hypothetical protein